MDEGEIDFQCKLEDALKSKDKTTVPLQRLRKLGVAQRIWNEKRLTYECHKEMWNTAERDTKTEMFQLIGFYLVVQGMLFQGVSQISSNMGRIGSCTEIFSLSVIISVLTSVGAIGGVYYKFLDLNAWIIERSNAETLRQIFDSRLMKLREEKEAFELSEVVMHNDLPKEKRWLVSRIAALVMLLLVVFTIIFPVSFNVILCK